MIIGIDFGTTFSETAHLDRHGTPTIIPNARGEHATPTVVYKPPSGPLLFGTDALEQAAIDPARLARSFKLKLGSTDSVLGDVDDYTATDAAAGILAHLKETASRHLGVEVAQAVITVPANFRDDSKQAIGSLQPASELLTETIGKIGGGQRAAALAGRRKASPQTSVAHASAGANSKTFCMIASVASSATPRSFSRP